MADTVPIAWVRQFEANAMLVAQQEGSVLWPFLNKKFEMKGGKFYFDKFEALEMKQKTRRGGLVTSSQQTWSRRVATPTDYELQTEHDSSDTRRMLIDPQSPATKSHGWAGGRKWDAIAYAAMLGSAYDADEDLDESGTALPTTQVIVNDSTNMTITKVNDAHEILDENHIPKPGRIMLYGANERKYLATSEDTFKSALYNAQTPLTGGTRPATFEWAGFTWVQYEDLTVGSSIRQCVAFHPMYVGLGVLQDIRTRASIEALAGYNLFIYTDMGGGAVRLQEEAVVRVDCLES